MSEASQEQMNRFVREVDSFMKNYSRLENERANVYASNNPALISDYENTLSQARILKSTIEATTGAWDAAKRAYSSVTAETSMIIGDAIDEIRSWFGYKPMGGLGALQLPAAAWVAGIISAAYLLNSTMTKIFVQIEASKIQRANPSISRDVALKQAAGAISAGSIFGRATLPLIAAGALAFYLLSR